MTRDMISSHWWRRFVYLLAALSAILFLASLILRAYLTDHRVEGWLRTELEKSYPHWKGSVKGADFSLIGWIPRPSLKIEKLALKSQGCSDQDIHIDMRDFTAQILWLDLVRGKLRVGPVSLRSFHATGDLLRSVCWNPVKSVQAPPSSSRKVAQVGGKNAPRRWVSSVRIAKAEWMWQRVGLRFENLSTQEIWSNSPIELSSQLVIQPQMWDANWWPALRLRTTISPQRFNWNVRGQFREGVIESQGQWHQSERKIEFQNEFKNFPISEVFAAVHGLRESPFHTATLSSWFSCRLNGTWSQSSEEAEVQVENCSLSGEGGKVQMDRLKLSHSSSTGQTDFEPFAIQFDRFEWSRLLKVIETDILGGVLAQYGLLSGKVEVQSREEATFTGSLNEASIAFSNRGVRGRQIVNSLRGRLQLKEGRVSGILDELSLQRGDFSGSLSFNFDREFREGLLQANIAEVSFDPTIQKLLSGGQTSPLALYGKLKVEDGKLMDWEGDLGLSRIENEHVQLSEIKVHSQWKDGALQLETLAQKGSVQRDSSFYDWIEPLFLEQEFKNEQVDLREFRAQMTVQKDALEWKKASVFVDEVKVSVSSEGAWDNEENLTGWVSVDFPDLKLVKWQLKGSLESPRLLPSSQWIRDLAKKKKRP